MQETKPNKAIVAVIVIVLLAAATAGVVYVLNRDQETSDTTTSQTPSTSSNETPSTGSTSGTYKDGTYSATGKYISPGGDESIDVTLAVASGKVTSANATTHAATSTSSQYQSEFTGSFKDLVVGKSIDEIKLSRVAGSSLTSNGFNDALEQIKDKAAA
jgi:hypothetical protein